MHGYITSHGDDLTENEHFVSRLSTDLEIARVVEPPAARTAGMLSTLQGSRRQLAHHGKQSPDP